MTRPDDFDSEGAGREMAEKEGWTVPIDREELEDALAYSKFSGAWSKEMTVIIAAARAHLASLPAPPESKMTRAHAAESLLSLSNTEISRWRNVDDDYRVALKMGSEALARLDELEAKVQKEEKKRATLAQMSSSCESAAHLQDGEDRPVSASNLREAAAVLRAVGEFKVDWVKHMGEPLSFNRGYQIAQLFVDGLP